jgi:hypothetical protein
MANGVGDSVQSGKDSAQANTAKKFQDESTAISTDASYSMKADQAYQTLVQNIKVM